MTTTFTTSGANSTLTIKFSAPTGKISAVLNDAVHELWKRGLGPHGTEEIPIAYDQLTLAQKEIIVDDYTRSIFINLAVNYKAALDAKAASDAVIANASTNYGL